MDYQDDYYETSCSKCGKFLGFGQDSDPYTPTDLICMNCYCKLEPINPYTKARREERNAGIIHQGLHCMLRKIKVPKLIINLDVLKK